MLVIEAKGALQENNITTYNIDHIELVLIRPANPSLLQRQLGIKRNYYAKQNTNQGTFNTL